MIFNRHFCVISLFSFFSVSLFSQSARPYPKDILPFYVDIIKPDDSFQACYLLAPFPLGQKPNSPHFSSPKPYILDKNGYVAWYSDNATGSYNSGFSYFEKVHRFAFINVSQEGKTVYVLLNEQFECVDTIQNTDNVPADGHEIGLFANGNTVIGGKSYTNYNVKTKKFTHDISDEKENIKALGYVLQILDKNKKLVYEWDSNQHISANDFVTEYGMNNKEFDYCHGNAIEQDSEGNFLVSFRNFDAIYKIDSTTGKVAWILGGKSNQFTFINDKGFSGQHFVRLLPNGNISLYDNATHSTEPKISRGVEYQLDISKMTATKVQEWKENYFGKSLGSYQNYQDKYHLLNYGFVFRPTPNISLLNAQNEPLTHISFPDSVMNYRAQIADIQQFIKRPIIKAHKIKGGYELSAPKNCEHYLWSNGETTRSIIIKEKGIYQVWTPQGIGMAGSLPFEWKKDD